MTVLTIAGWHQPRPEKWEAFTAFLQGGICMQLLIQRTPFSSNDFWKVIIEEIIPIHPVYRHIILVFSLSWIVSFSRPGKMSLTYSVCLQSLLWTYSKQIICTVGLKYIFLFCLLLNYKRLWGSPLSKTIHSVSAKGSSTWSQAIVSHSVFIFTNAVFFWLAYFFIRITKD